MSGESRELRELRDDLSRVVGTVCHDLRAPLRAMSGFAEVLLEEYAAELDADGRDCAERIVAAAERMEHTVAKLDAYGRLVALAEAQPAPMELVSAVRLALMQLEERQEERGLDVRVEVPAEVKVLADEAVLVASLVELLDNALIWSSAGPVRIHVGGAETVRLCIDDDGPGLSEDECEQVFEFGRKAHRHPEIPGAGIGLTTARRGAALLGGRVGAEPREPTGTRFWIELPAAGHEGGR